jgi:hypothetical protein
MKLLMAGAIIASVVIITACSDTTAPKELAAGGGLGPRIAASAHRVYATCTFASVGAKENRTFANLGGGAVLFSDGTGSLGGIISFDGRNKYAMNMSSWTGLDANADGTPEAFRIVGTWTPINFEGPILPWDLIFPVTGTPINLEGFNGFKVRCTLN